MGEIPTEKERMDTKLTMARRCLKEAHGYLRDAEAIAKKEVPAYEKAEYICCAFATDIEGIICIDRAIGGLAGFHRAVIANWG